MKYIFVLLVCLAITAPLLTVDGFNYWAWSSLSVILTCYYGIKMAEATNLKNAANIVGNRVDKVASKIDKLIDLVKHNTSSNDTVNEKMLSELRKIRKTVRHEVKDL